MFRYVVLAQAKEEQEKRVRAERELTELKAKISKEVCGPHAMSPTHLAHPDVGVKALLQSSVAETWPDVSAALPKLDELCTPIATSPPGEQRRTSQPLSNRQTPPSSAPEAFSTGLATPQSRVSTVDAEPAPSERATSEVDPTVSGNEGDPHFTGSRKRAASPSSLDGEQSALKRRRVQELMGCAPRSSVERAGTPESQSPRPPCPSSLSPSTTVHEFGAAPLLMGSPTP